MSLNQMSPLVSVASCTFNHEKYIEQALISVLNQKTNFPFEIVIGNDCSTDKTRSIIEKYQVNYPNIINLINHPYNIGALNNMPSVLEMCKGKYIAYIDGDDFWTDELKLQKQVDFLEENAEFVACQHENSVVNSEGHLLRKTLWETPIPEKITQQELFISSNLSQTSTWMMRGEYFKNMPKFVKNCCYDRVIAFYLTDFGKWATIPGSMAAYRIHETGSHSMQSNLTKTNQLLVMFSSLYQQSTYRKKYSTELRLKLRFYYFEKSKVQLSNRSYFKFVSSAIRSVNYTDTLKGKINTFLSYFRKNETHD